MNDLISRQAAIDWLKNEWDGMVTSVFKGIENLPSEQPTADVVEVVRCKDCNFYYNGRTQCLIHDSTGYRPDDFCSYGERADKPTADEAETYLRNRARAIGVESDKCMRNQDAYFEAMDSTQEMAERADT